MNIKNMLNVSRLLLIVAAVGCNSVNAAQTPDGLKSTQSRGSVANRIQNNPAFVEESLRAVNKGLMKEKETLVKEKEAVQKSLFDTLCPKYTIQEMSLLNDVTVSEYAPETLRGQTIQELAQDLQTQMTELRAKIKKAQVMKSKIYIGLKEINMEIMEHAGFGWSDDGYTIQEHLDTLKEQVGALLNQSDVNVKTIQTYETQIKMAEDLLPEFSGVTVVKTSLEDRIKNMLSYTNSRINYYRASIVLLSAIIVLLVCDKYGKIQLPTVDFSSLL